MSNVRDFGARGDGKTDDTAAVAHAVTQGEGTIQFPPGDYILSKTIRVELDKTGRLGIEGAAGTAKILMRGPGPAFHLVGTHARTADPDGFKPAVWARQRMPSVLNLEIQGQHPQASGFLVEGLMQPTFEGVLLRELFDGIRLHTRARNLIVSHCHIYHCRGVGIFLDRVNLHQSIICGSHISYCKASGIKIAGSEVRNLQITGCDIEYNHDTRAEKSADIFIDATDQRASVREVTIAGNTIQALLSPGGANIRIDGHNRQRDHQASLITISGNLIGNQQDAIHLRSCRAVVLSGNVVYGGYHRTLLVEDSQNIVLSGNSFDHRPHLIRTGLRFVDSQDIQISGGHLHDVEDGKTIETDENDDYRGLLEIIRCRRVGVAGVQILDGYPRGAYVQDSSDVNFSGCSVLNTGIKRKPQESVRFNGKGAGNLITGCRIGPATGKALNVDETADVTLGKNVIDGA